MIRPWSRSWCAGFLAWLCGCACVQGQKDFLFDETLAPHDTKDHHQIDAGFLYSGADSPDLDRGVFGWSTVTYAAYRWRLDDKDQIRLRHQFWQYINDNQRQVAELSWWHQTKPNHAISFSADYLIEKEGYQLGSGYFGYQGLACKNWLYFVQGGLGGDSQHDIHGDVFIDLLKPLSSSTLLRFRNEYFAATSDYYQDTTSLNLIQALSHRLAFNVGYRFFANHEIRDGVNDLVSHEGSATLIFQARHNVFLSGRYRHYWNSAARELNSYSSEARWHPTPRFSLIGGYQLEQFRTGLLNHEFRAGVSFSF